MNHDDQLKFIQRRISDMNGTTAEMERMTERLSRETERLESAKAAWDAKNEPVTGPGRVALFSIGAIAGVAGASLMQILIR